MPAKPFLTDWMLASSKLSQFAGSWGSAFLPVFKLQGHFGSLPFSSGGPYFQTTHWLTCFSSSGTASYLSYSLKGIALSSGLVSAFAVELRRAEDWSLVIPSALRSGGLRLVLWHCRGPLLLVSVVFAAPGA